MCILVQFLLTFTLAGLPLCNNHQLLWWIVNCLCSSLFSFVVHLFSSLVFRCPQCTYTEIDRVKSPVSVHRHNKADLITSILFIYLWKTVYIYTYIIWIDRLCITDCIIYHIYTLDIKTMHIYKLYNIFIFDIYINKMYLYVIYC